MVSKRTESQPFEEIRLRCSPNV